MYQNITYNDDDFSYVYERNGTKVNGTKGNDQGFTLNGTVMDTDVYVRVPEETNSTNGQVLYEAKVSDKDEEWWTYVRTA